MPDLDFAARDLFLDGLRPGDVVLAAGDRAVVKHIYPGMGIALVAQLSGADVWVCELSQIEADVPALVAEVSATRPAPTERLRRAGLLPRARESATVDDAPHGDDMSPEEIMDYEG